ncbi:hypothetical protein PT313_02645 [Metamycoplasma hyosynoviae]|uniref:HipA family kinase n=1 Tax=Metamycoplasma hyosynoviae TaxID=29559 RepID=UPI00049F5FD2|nr:HipA family kinase [Metamycoplasma hyosynoviae]KDE44321.1 hypothetical protein NPL2_03330 [Metamycoplasma hyosynoviae]MDC8911695.1 hypothetical protein [Metamycoplasma hyosynoviae]MDC8916173.1 hypothetical protein [Metamycoplasma hyosynoviae]MDC8919083.1 hypothetical protein [Metamycoplasma hyosynoviae]MDC8920448.1 hypothetical protein [Metamycoplasma hyosynoviae]
MSRYIFKNLDIDCFSFEYNIETDELTNIEKHVGLALILPLLGKFDERSIRKYLFHTRFLAESRADFSGQFLDDRDIFRIYLKNYGLNLEDNFWLVSDQEKSLNWLNINHFDHFTNDLAKIYDKGSMSLEELETKKSPDYFTRGNLPKTWIQDGEGIFLLKTSSKFEDKIELYEVYAEYFASKIAKLLSLNCLDYEIIEHETKMVNKCKLFTSKKLSYLPFANLYHGDKSSKENMQKFVTKFFSKQYFEDLMVFDSVILNNDRHLGNFGILVDSRTRRIVDNAPIYDNGRSLIFDFKYYKSSIGRQNIADYSMRSTKFYKSFDKQLYDNLCPRHAMWVKLLEKFKLKNHPEYPAPSSYFNSVKKIIKTQVQKMKEILKEKYNI